MQDSCTKTKFINEKYALEYVKKLQATSVRSKKPQSAYLCPVCMTWHLTSKIHDDYYLVNKLRQDIQEKRNLINKLCLAISELKIEVKKLKLEKQGSWKLTNQTK